MTAYKIQIQADSSTPPPWNRGWTTGFYLDGGHPRIWDNPYDAVQYVHDHGANTNGNLFRIVDGTDIPVTGPFAWDTDPKIRVADTLTDAVKRIDKTIEELKSESWEDESARVGVLTGLKIARAKVSGDHRHPGDPFDVETISASLDGSIKVKKQTAKRDGSVRIQVSLPDGRFLVCTKTGWRIWNSTGMQPNRQGDWT
jgi:hypothetical protein